jgi:hypothetical protein
VVKAPEITNPIVIEILPATPSLPSYFEHETNHASVAESRIREKETYITNT